MAEKYHLTLWCEAEGCLHPVLDEGKGRYELEATREWVQLVAPYANFAAGVLKMVLPVVAPAVNVCFGADTVKNSGWADHLDLMKTASGRFLKEITVADPAMRRDGVLTMAERSGVLALHRMLREKDPTHARLGSRRVPTYTGDYLWLCDKHYQEMQPKIPDKIEFSD